MIRHYRFDNASFYGIVLRKDFQKIMQTSLKSFEKELFKDKLKKSE